MHESNNALCLAMYLLFILAILYFIRTTLQFIIFRQRLKMNDKLGFIGEFLKLVYVWLRTHTVRPYGVCIVNNAIS